MLLLCSTFDFVLEGLKSFDDVDMGVEELAIIMQKEREETMDKSEEKEQRKEKVRSIKALMLEEGKGQGKDRDK